MPSLFPESAAPASPQTWITAHCDGGARGNPGPAGYGAVITGPHGELLAELSQYLGHRTNNFAEYSGLLGVLRWAHDNHHLQLRVISDSELMVKQIQGKYKVKSPDLLPLWQQARDLIAQLDRFEISHALRHKNKDADRLANQAMDAGTGKSPAQSLPAEPSSRPDPERAKGALARPASPPPQKQMLRGFTRDNTIHLLGNATLPDGLFVKIIPE